MHELTLCRNILQIIEEHATRDSFDRVKRVCLDVGILAAIEPEAMYFGFDVASRGTIAEGARLEISTVAAKGHCPACKARVSIDHIEGGCPHCGSRQLCIEGGDEMRIRKLEVE